MPKSGAWGAGPRLPTTAVDLSFHVNLHFKSSYISSSLSTTRRNSRWVVSGEAGSHYIVPEQQLPGADNLTLLSFIRPVAAKQGLIIAGRLFPQHTFPPFLLLPASCSAITGTRAANITSITQLRKYTNTQRHKYTNTKLQKIHFAAPLLAARC